MSDMSNLHRFKRRIFKPKQKRMLLLEVLLSVSVMTVLAVMLMTNLGYFYLRGQKEKAEFAYETQMQMLDLMVVKFFEEMSIHLQTSSKAHLPLYIDEREGKKSLIVYILHAQDAEKEFAGLLQCMLTFDKGVLKLIEENDHYKKREIELLKAQNVAFEFFDPESKSWVDAWIKEKENPAPLLRIVITRDEKIKNSQMLYYLTPFMKSPLSL